MQKRIKQFLAALTARIEPNDKAFLKQWLTASQRRLFCAMAIADQYHALQVAYTAMELAAKRQCSVDQQKLLQCCLLHDVGKRRGDISTIDKVFTVLANASIPRQARKWSKAGRGGRVQNIRHALYVYYQHAQCGYRELWALGYSEIALIVAKHHDQQCLNDPPELLLLREADELN